MPPSSIGSGWQRGLVWLLEAASRLLDVLYPRHCPLCGADGGGSLCEVCRVELGGVGGDRCGRCGQLSGPHVLAGRLSGCVHCRRRHFAYEGVERLGLYAGSLRAACIQGKSSAGGPLVWALGEWLFECRCSELRGLGIDLVVPVPQHWTKRIRVVHNQAETLASGLCRSLRVPLGRHILRKARRTPDQSSLPGVSRRANLSGAFCVRRRSDLDGLHVLLVDDILTTGTTAHQAALALRRGGARCVSVAVLAVVSETVDRFN